ncbi:hypothetical protein [Agromyces archimandritae]|uniref:Uncharacterized protein n=1 Tax=Agromyces archimandritae TaxID=2781962 RepID=A0A975FLK3_9MICO|nr:hypothetical protein [Agromyces archimandritae]QTX04137.1 hypothetical protein G127AT_12665 [Agromyces archimandritae]
MTKSQQDGAYEQIPAEAGLPGSSPGLVPDEDTGAEPGLEGFVLPPLASDAMLEERMTELLRSALRRQWWTFFLDERGRFLVAMPMADYPEDPDEPLSAPLGGTPAELLADRLSEIREDAGAEAVVFAWERSGSSEISADDRAWALSLASACASRRVRVRAQFIVHDDGVRIIASDQRV